MTCSQCGAEAQTKTDRVPSGWKRHKEEIWCGKCWTKKYMLRAVALPVASCDDWKTFNASCNEMWRVTTAASNWMMTELYARDIRPNGEPKMPKMPKTYLYPETRTRFPLLPSQTCACLEQAVAKKYRAKRFEILWICKSSLPTYRYPTPFPVPNQGWSAWLDKERPHVSVRLGDKRWTLRLRSGPQFRRQLTSFRQLVSGEAVQGQLDLYSKNKTTMCKMVAWLPRPQTMQGTEGTLIVRTGAGSLLRAFNFKDEKLWEYHADHVVRWSAEHQRLVKRLADDQKFEQRPVPTFQQRRTDAAIKYRDRMSSAVREIASQLVKYAVRRKFASLTYDDSDVSHCEQFTWFALRERIATKCDEMGIEFEHKPTVAASAPEEVEEEA